MFFALRVSLVCVSNVEYIKMRIFSISWLIKMRKCTFIASNCFSSSTKTCDIASTTDHKVRHNLFFSTSNINKNNNNFISRHNSSYDACDMEAKIYKNIILICSYQTKKLTFSFDELSLSFFLGLLPKLVPPT